jgi:iodotyrosine deiodinase
MSEIDPDEYPYTGVGEYVPYAGPRFTDEAASERAGLFFSLMNSRRSVRQYSDRAVPRELIDAAIATAGTAPSGAHQQPWTFVLIGDQDTKLKIHKAAEDEERKNYIDGRMPDDWKDAIARLGTGWRKDYLKTVPWIVVLFEQRFGIDDAGEKQKHYYVKESVGIAAGMFIAALHNMGLATLTHTPSPMAFLTKLLGRPSNERPFVVFPIGYPSDEAVVPVLGRKNLSEILVDVGGDS